MFGEYPAYLLAKFRNEGLNIQMEKDDLNIMKKYPVDFVSFSYYMSSCSAKSVEGLDTAVGNLSLIHIYWESRNCYFIVE